MKGNAPIAVEQFHAVFPVYYLVSIALLLLIMTLAKINYELMG